MAKTKTIIIFLLFFIIFLTTVTASQMGSSNYNFSLLVDSSGGTNISSVNYKVDSMLSTNTGDFSSNSYNLSLGFFYDTGSSETESNSNSGGGGSSGGRSIGGVSTFNIGELLTMHPLIFNMLPGNKLKFNFKGQGYVIQLTSILDKTARFVIENNPIFLNKGNTESIDIDKDGIKDIELTVLDIARNVVKVRLSALPIVFSKQISQIKEQSEEEIIPEEKTLSKSEDEIAEDKTVITLKRSAINSKIYLTAILTIIMLIIIITAIMFWTKKK